MDMSEIFPNLYIYILKTNLMHKFRFIFIAVFFLGAIVSCSESKFDYRHKYVGEYNVNLLQIDGRGTNTGDSALYILPCSIDFSEERKSLSFDLPDMLLAFEANIDRKGALRMTDVEPEKFTGEFTDKANFSIVYKSSDFFGNTFRNEMKGVRK